LNNITSYIKGFFLRVGAGVKTRVIEVIETIRFNYNKGFKTGITLNRLSNIILSYIKSFFSKVRVKAGVRTGIVIRVFRTIRIIRILRIVKVII
jgi:hypothetical protein